MHDALVSYRKQTGKPHPIELKAPPAPAAHTYLLRIFNVMNRGRDYHEQTGWLPLPPTEIHAGALLLGITLRRWELDAVLRLDDCWRKVMGEAGHSFEDDE